MGLRIGWALRGVCWRSNYNFGELYLFSGLHHHNLHYLDNKGYYLHAVALALMILESFSVSLTQHWLS
jgi:hypothetical protein